MSGPVRIQLSRTKGWRMPPNTVKVDRTTRWGNPARWTDLPAVTHDDDGEPVRHTDDTRRWWATLDFEASIKHDIGRPANYPTNDEIRLGLAGKNLGCWCRLCPAHRDGKPLGLQCDDCSPCHADPLGEVANAPEPKP